MTQSIINVNLKTPKILPLSCFYLQLNPQRIVKIKNRDNLTPITQNHGEIYISFKEISLTELNKLLEASKIKNVTELEDTLDTFLIYKMKKLDGIMTDISTKNLFLMYSQNTLENNDQTIILPFYKGYISNKIHQFFTYTNN